MRISITYDEVRHTARKNGNCSVCHRRVQRRRTFTQTLNPYNRTATGELKNTQQIRAELKAQAQAWRPDFMHEACRADEARRREDSDAPVKSGHIAWSKVRREHLQRLKDHLEGLQNKGE